MPLFFTLLAFFFIHYIHTFLHPWTFAEAPLHSLIADQLSGRHLPGVPSRDSNSGPLYSEPTCYQLSHAAPYWAMPHPNWAMANFTCMWRRAQLHFNFHLCMTPFISACRLSYPILLLTYTSALRISSLHDTFHLYMTIFIPTWRFLTLHAGFISAYMFSSLHDTFHLCVSPFTSVL